jgi:hypothetical protein
MRVRVACGAEQRLDPLGGRRQLRHAASKIDGVVDRRRDRRADAGNAAFPDTLYTQRVERTRRVLGQQYLDRWNFVRCRQEIVGKRHAERLAAVVVDELLV